MNSHNLNTDFSDLKILVVGDVILDEFVYSNSYRTSPEFPVPVYAVESQKFYPGGAANVAANILALGAQVELVSVIGEDNEAKKLMTLLAEINCSTDHLIKTNKRITSKKSRLFSGGKPIARIDKELTHNINSENADKLLNQTKLNLQTMQFDGIILQDYNKGVLNSHTIEKIISIGLEMDIPVFVDPKINNYKAYDGVYVFKPNLNELAEILGYRPEINLDSLDIAAKKLRTYVNHDTLVLTLSDKGAYFSSKNGSGIVPTLAIENADVCGAGDSFISALTLCLCKKMPINDAISLANRVSAVVCRKEGVCTCDISEI